MGVGDAARDAKLINGAVNDLTLITGQEAVERSARPRKSIAQFKLREWHADRCAVTLRGAGFLRKDYGLVDGAPGIDRNGLRNGSDWIDVVDEWTRRNGRHEMEWKNWNGRLHLPYRVRPSPRRNLQVRPVPNLACVRWRSRRNRPVCQKSSW